VDDFPLSWFPMFSKPRPEYETPIYVVALDADGARHKVSQRYWTSGGFNQGATQLIKTSKKGKDALREMCERIAKKVGSSKVSDYRASTGISIFKGVYSRESWFRDGNHEPIREARLVSCEIER
jgi:hypothetical protein